MLFNMQNNPPQPLIWVQSRRLSIHDWFCPLKSLPQTESQLHQPLHHDCDRQTDRQTDREMDHTTISKPVSIGWFWYIADDAMRPIIQIITEREELNQSSFVCRCRVWSQQNMSNCSCLESCHTVDDSSQDDIHPRLNHHHHHHHHHHTCQSTASSSITVWLCVCSRSNIYEKPCQSLMFARILPGL